MQALFDETILPAGNIGLRRRRQAQVVLSEPELLLASPLTIVLYSDAISISSVPSPQCARPE